MLTDIKYNFGHNPLYPVYGGGPQALRANAEQMRFNEYGGGIVLVGAAVEVSFAFDNEQPRHEALLHPFKLADRLVTNLNAI